MIWKTQPRSEFGDLRAITAGAGDKVLLLHGVGLRAEAWNGIIDRLRSSYEIIAPDMVGHGQSTPFDHVPTLADYTDRVARAMDASMHVVGHSMGAMIALDLAARYPQKVLSVVALNAIYQRSDAARAAVQARAAQIGQTPIDPSATIARWFDDPADPAALACDEWLRSVDPAGYGAAYRVFAQEDGPSPEALAQMSCPALFFTGARDPNSTEQMSRDMASVAKNGTAMAISDAAHMMPMTHTDTVAGVLADFFAKAGA